MNKYRHFLFTIIYIFILNIVFSLVLFKSVQVDSVLFYLFESVTVSSIITLLCEFFKGKTKKIVLLVLVFFVSILFLSQYVHYNFYDCFYSIFSLNHGSQVFGFIPAIIKVIGQNIWGFILLVFLYVVFLIAILKTDEVSYKKRSLFILIVLIINLIVATLIIVLPSSNDNYSRKNLLKNTNIELKNVQKFGLVTGMSIDLKRYLFGYNYNLLKDKVYDKDFYDSKNYNIINGTFDNINTDDETIRNVTRYLENKRPSNKNKYTGIFNNKNLIFITAESFSFDVIDKKLTPTLYKLQNEGFSFSNFYTPIYYASTSDGEYTNLTGLLPRDGVWSYLTSKNNYYPYNYAAVFNELGYKSVSFHDGEYDFYQRNEVMPNFGYSYKGCGNGLENYINCDIWPQSDDEMFSKSLKFYENYNKFNVYYMTISSHLNHDFKNNAMAKKHQNKVNSLSYHKATKAYISATIDLDNALNDLMNELKKLNKLDDTVIVLVPDHYPYGLSQKEYSDLGKTYTEYSKHKSGLIIYNSKIKGKIINKYASNIDILPTLLNMYGVDYDSRLIIGNDIMSNTGGIVIFNDRSFLTEKGYYNEKINKFYAFEKTNDDYINQKRNEVYNKTNVSSIINELNYYKYLK